MGGRERKGNVGLEEREIEEDGGGCRMREGEGGGERGERRKRERERGGKGYVVTVIVVYFSLSLCSSQPRNHSCGLQSALSSCQKHPLPTLRCASPLRVWTAV